MRSASLIAKKPPGSLRGETPFDFPSQGVREGVPGARSTDQFADSRDTVAAYALARPKADLDLAWTEPPRTLGRVVDRETLPQLPAHPGSEGLDEGFLAVRVEVVVDHMDRLGFALA